MRTVLRVSGPSCACLLAAQLTRSTSVTDPPTGLCNYADGIPTIGKRPTRRLLVNRAYCSSDGYCLKSIKREDACDLPIL